MPYKGISEKATAIVVTVDRQLYKSESSKRCSLWHWTAAYLQFSARQQHTTESWLQIYLHRENVHLYKHNTWVGGTSDYMVHAIRWKYEERGYAEICRENENDEVQGEWRKKPGFLCNHTLCCKERSSRLCTLRKRSKPQEATNGREGWHCNPRTAPARPLRHPRTSPAGRERRKQGQTKQHSQEFNNIALHKWRTAGQIHPLYLEHTQIQDKKTLSNGASVQNNRFCADPNLPKRKNKRSIHQLLTFPEVKDGKLPVSVAHDHCALAGRKRERCERVLSKPSLQHRPSLRRRGVIHAHLTEENREGKIFWVTFDHRRLPLDTTEDMNKYNSKGLGTCWKNTICSQFISGSFIANKYN